jgi:regulator of RNase E activity RraB
MSEEFEDHCNDYVESEALKFERLGEELRDIITRMIEDVSDLSVIGELEINFSRPDLTDDDKVAEVALAFINTMDLSDDCHPQIMKGVKS